jgi:hypothetical protein
MHNNMLQCTIILSSAIGELQACATFMYPAHAVFGGYKESGFGRETHKIILDHYQQTKNLLVSYSHRGALPMQAQRGVSTGLSAAPASDAVGLSRLRFAISVAMPARFPHHDFRRARGDNRKQRLERVVVE